MRYTKIFCIITIIGCSSETFDPTTTDKVVVEGYLYVGQNVNSIHLNQLIPLLTNEEDTYAIDDADLSISWNGEDYFLISNQNEPGNYYYDGEELKVLEGETYELNFDYFGNNISAGTTVPTRPSNVSLSLQILEIAPIIEFEDIFNRGELETIELTWENSDNEYYFIVVENTEEEPEEINQIDFDGEQRGNFTFITEPTNLSVYNIQPFSLTQYGSYRVIIYHVSQEYVDLYETSGEQDSRNLTEPLSNIQNGLGIFTSFNSDTLYLEVVKP